jgi:predicted peptidase
MRTYIILSFLILSGAICFSQDLSLYEKHNFIRGNDTLPYRLLLPEKYDASKKYPLVLFLHGAGERGNDNEKQLTHGARLFLNETARKQYPAIVVFPQCPASSFWSSVNFKRDGDGKLQFIFSDTAQATIAMQLVQQLLQEILKSYPVSSKQIYVAGLSMGGMGTFEIVSRNPGLFAAAIPICGGGAPSSAKLLKQTRWWVFHGGKDNVVPLSYSEQMVKALEAVKADVKFTVYPDATHNSWDPAFAEPDLLNWLFHSTKIN